MTNSTISPGSNVSLLLSDLSIRNPGSTKNSASVYVYTTYNDQTVDYGYSSKFTAIPAILLSASVSPNSLVTNKRNTDYTFTIRPSGQILQQASIKIILPSDVEINSSLFIESNCTLNAVSGVTLQKGKLPIFNCEVTDSGSVIKIYGLFAYGSTNDYATVSFAIPGF